MSVGRGFSDSLKCDWCQLNEGIPGIPPARARLLRTGVILGTSRVCGEAGLLMRRDL